VAGFIPLRLPPTLTAAYSTAACIPLPDGWLPDGVTPQLTENGVVIPSQPLVPSKYRGAQAARWLKLHAKFDPAKTYRVWDGIVGVAPTATSLPADITIVPYLSDSSANDYTPTGETLTTLENGDVCKVVYQTGTMHKASVTDWLTYHIWIRYYADVIRVEAQFTVIGTASTVKPIKTLGFTCTPPASWQTFLRDEGNRAPFARSGSNIELWADGGYPAVALTDINFHTRPWEYSGTNLLLMPPAAALTYAGTYAATYPTEGEGDTSQMVAQMTGYDPRGRKIACQFAFFKDTYPAGTYRTLLQNDPVPMPSPADCCASGAFGPCRPRSTTYPAHETLDEAALLTYNDQTKPSRLHSHWNDWGDTPERITGGHSNAKRLHAGHYPQASLALKVFRGSGQAMLDCFRKLSSFLRDNLQCDFAGVHAYKTDWGFSHGKAFHPDGFSVDPGGLTGDTDYSLTGHWPDPYSIQLRWLIDHSYYHKQGLDGWATAVSFAEDSYGREASETLAQAVYLWRYQGSSFSAAHQTQMYTRAETFITKDIYQQLLDGEISPLSNCLVCSHAHEVLNNEASKQYILRNAAAIARIPAPYSAYQIEGSSTLALMAHAVKLGGSSTLLASVIPPVAPTPSSNLEFPIGAGPLGELNQGYAWPVAQYYLGLDEGTTSVSLSINTKLAIQSAFPSPTAGQVVSTNIDKIADAPTLTNAVVNASSSGQKMAFGEVVLDGSNPTPVTTGLTSITSACVSIKKNSALGDDPIQVSYDTSGGTLNIYAHKTDGSDPTLVASTNSTVTIGWQAYGT
jgi:hypothetical protein